MEKATISTTAEPEFYTIDTIPAPTEPMGIGMQRLAEKLKTLNMSWLDEEPVLTMDDICYIAAKRLASVLNQ